MTTFERLMSDKTQKDLFEKEYAEFLLSEFLLEAMQENNVSVRKLSEESGVSTSIIQNIRSQKSDNITLKTISSLFSALGYKLAAIKDNRAIAIG